MSGVNKVIIVGRLGQDPKVTGPATSITVATSEKWKDKDGKENEKTEWHNIVAFGKLGELWAKHLTKGQQVYVEGKLQTDKYEKDGVTKYSTKIIANQFQFIGSKQDQSSGNLFEQSSDIPF